MRKSFFRVTFFAMLVLVVETVLFNVLMYLDNFFSATAVISYAVLGIALGAFAASRIRIEESLLFFVCCVGTAAGLYGASMLLVWYPVMTAVVGAVAACVFFPVLYIAVMFREHPGGRVYLFDMAGAGAGVAVTVALYELLTSEGIVLLLAGAMPAIGLANCFFRRQQSTKRKVILSIIGVPAAALGFVLFGQQILFDSYNIYRIFNREAPHENRKIFKSFPPDRLVATYDSLVGRIDVMKNPGEKEWGVAYNGWANDHFGPASKKTYASYKKEGVKWPSGDARVFYGLKDSPQVYIIGSAAHGVIEVVKRITLLHHIFAVEINPGLVELMQDDFYNESGRVYQGLTPVVGNALSQLKSLNRKFDVITMINTHSDRNIGDRTGPDYLHTAEHYKLYLDHLSADGYMLFEERPFSRSGELGFYRMLNTAWHTLAADGAKDPSRHFFIWEWISRSRYHGIQKPYDHKRDMYVEAPKWYVGMIVTKSPLVGERKKKALAWFFEAAGGPVRAMYMKDTIEHGEVSDVFKMIETGDFSKLAKDDFDETIVTNDRPFPSLSTKSTPQVEKLLAISGVICGALTLLFLAGAFFRARPARAAFLSAFNILIGFGYFFVEIMLIQVYQNVFVSPAWSLILVLGVLLLSSGLGGHFTGRLKSWQATALLIPVSLTAIYLPSFLLETGIPIWIGKGISIALIAATGFLLGVFFPRGLTLADKWELKRKVPIMFAINSVAGSFAVMLALYSGIRIGYQTTIIIAVLFYCIAGLMLTVADGKARA